MTIKQFTMGISTFFIGTALNAKLIDSMQTIEVVNNSARIMNLTSSNTDNSMSLKQVVPAFTKSLVLIHMTQLKSLQDMLFEAILDNSADEVRRAVQLGANVNLEKDGKRPLLWAVSFQRMYAVKALIECGAC